MQFIFNILVIQFFSVFKKPAPKAQAQAVKNNEDSDQYFIGGLRSYNHVRVSIFVFSLITKHLLQSSDFTDWLIF